MSLIKLELFVLSVTLPDSRGTILLAISHLARARVAKKKKNTDGRCGARCRTSEIEGKIPLCEPCFTKNKNNTKVSCFALACTLSLFTLSGYQISLLSKKRKIKKRRAGYGERQKGHLPEVMQATVEPAFRRKKESHFLPRTHNGVHTQPIPSDNSSGALPRGRPRITPIKYSASTVGFCTRRRRPAVRLEASWRP